jgi:hypothetical protein
MSLLESPACPPPRSPCGQTASTDGDAESVEQTRHVECCASYMRQFSLSKEGFADV